MPACGGERQRENELSRFGRYADAVKAEITARAEEIRSTLPSGCFSGKVDTLYMGGGTPSVLPSSVIRDIVHHLNRTVFGTEEHDYLEFTIEVNPEDIIGKGEPYLEELASCGVNRISMGMQSLDDTVLRWMNRRHDAERAVEAYWMLRGYGFRNISIDLIFGIGGLSEESWEATVSKVVGLSPSHISAYQLSIEDGSSLARLVEAGKYVEASEEECRRQYDFLCAKLYEAGYHHYEVSNFAYSGFEARHNSAYWRRVPYVGLGPGAHSAVAGPDGKVNVRRWNSEAIPEYHPGSEVLTEEDIRVEEIMLALRTDIGIDLDKLPCDAAQRLLAEGVLEHALGRKVRIPENRFFVSDEIIRELI